MEVEYMRSEYIRAATGALDQYHQFSEAELLRFLQEEHPGIDPAHRFPLLMGAVAGVQFAAKLHVLIVFNESSLDERARAIASNASAVLSCLNLGLHQGACPMFSYAGDSTLESLETTLDMDQSANSPPASVASSTVSVVGSASSGPANPAVRHRTSSFAYRSSPRRPSSFLRSIDQHRQPRWTFV